MGTRVVGPARVSRPGPPKLASRLDPVVIGQKQPKDAWDT